MAQRVVSRRALRDQNDQSERAETEEPDTGVEAADDADDDEKPKKRRKKATTKVPKVKGPAKPRVRKKSSKADPRMCAMWAVCDHALKRLAMFEYKDRAGADAKLAEIREKKTGTFLILMVKEPYDPPAVEPAVAV